ncbi:MAG: D-amino-acid transaminase [Granulosicoccus sp.]
MDNTHQIDWTDPLMSRTFYVNGDFVAEENAKISVLDRGFLFADAVYEVSTILNGKLIDNAAHLKRLARSLSELSMAPPCSDDEILAAQEQLLKLNGVEEGLLYLQVSRGAADRDFAYPQNARSSLVMFTQKKSLLDSALAKQGMHIISIPDLRWKRRDIKTVGLLAPSMGKQAAVDAGVHDAWMVEDGLVTEGTSNNAYIVTVDKVIQTRQLGHEILSGITRQAVLKFARTAGYTVVEEPFTIEAARQASEAFITSASSFVMPVVNIDGVALGDGSPGPVSTQLRKIYIETALEHQDL